jgi:SAM-dependent methyltransferase
MKPTLTCRVFLSALLLAAVPLAAQEPEPHVPYVPTPPAVVRAMLEVAAVGPHDLVYDLGSGDGRIVIAAARDFGARGVGVEIEADLVEEARRNARASGVADRVRFLQQDLFATDLREASVVALYLLPIVNYRLQPKLLRELKPGSRVVSHAFDMADWEPDQEFQVDGRWVFYWVVPAVVRGRWTWGVGECSALRVSARLEQRFQHVSGTATARGASTMLEDVELRGAHIAFTLVTRESGVAVRMRHQGEVMGDAIEGWIEVDAGPLRGTHSWSAVRR